MWSIWGTGLMSGLALIVALGAQNAFVLRQGIRREHVGVVVALCAVSDAVLILGGTAGIGALVSRFPEALDVLRGRQVDLAVIDLMLPKLNGKGLIATIRTDPDLAGLPVVVVTATSGETAEGELRPFVQAWHTKSAVTMADIERTIAGLIDNPPPTTR